MRNNFFVIVLFFLSGCDTGNNVDPVYQDYFIKYFGGAGDQRGADLLVNEDGSMILLGNSIAPSGIYTAFITKVNRYGNVMWERQLGDVNETAVDIELIKSGSQAGNLIVATNIGVEANSRIRILRLNQDGTGIDSVIVPLHENGVKQVATTVTSLVNDPGYVVSGYADKNLIQETLPVSDDNDQQDILVFKFDESLTFLGKVLNKGGEKKGAGIKTFEWDGGITDRLVVFGFSDKPLPTEASDGLFELNYTYDAPEYGIPTATGDIVGTPSEEELLATVIQTTSPNGFLLAGTSRTPGNSSGDIYLVEYNSSFEVKNLDVKIDLGRSLECVAADNTPSSGYYILGNETTLSGLKDLALIKVSYDGQAEWIRNFGTAQGEDTSAAIATLPDGRIAIVGTMELATNKKLALVVLNNRGGLTK
ncbi:MAG TPA: hypothetical protein VD884_17795 [Ohtaekwangia sp.]|nr:hypothetical protein [Ohtaekwangia sp.]